MMRFASVKKSESGGSFSQLTIKSRFSPVSFLPSCRYDLVGGSTARECMLRPQAQIIPFRRTFKPLLPRQSAKASMLAASQETHCTFAFTFPPTK